MDLHPPKVFYLTQIGINQCASASHGNVTFGRAKLVLEVQPATGNVTFG